MPEITFNEEPDIAVQQHVPTAPQKGLVPFLIANGVAKDARQATIIIVGVVIACLLAVLFIWFPRGTEVEYVTTPADLGSAGGPQDFVEGSTR